MHMGIEMGMENSHFFFGNSAPIPDPVSHIGFSYRVSVAEEFRLIIGWDLPALVASGGSGPPLIDLVDLDILYYISKNRVFMPAFNAFHAFLKSGSVGAYTTFSNHVRNSCICSRSWSL
jgi:hypothetical protein